MPPVAGPDGVSSKFNYSKGHMSVRKFLSILAISAFAFQVGCNEQVQPSKEGSGPANPMNNSKISQHPSAGGAGPAMPSSPKPPTENPDKPK
jgi:hypothetical protein